MKHQLEVYLILNIFINLDDYYTANQLALIIDLFCFFVDHHNFSMRVFVLQKNLLNFVLVYLKSKHHFLALCKFIIKIIF